MTRNSLKLLLIEHVYDLTMLDDGRHSLLCTCGWVSEPTESVEVSSNDMVEHFLSLMSLP